MVITVSGYKNPPSTEPSETFTFQLINIVSSTEYLINVYSTSVTIATTTAATILVSSISHESADALAVTTFLLSFQSVHSIPIGGIVKITYPEQIGIDQNTFGCTVNIATSPSCTYDTATRTITVSNAFTNTLAAGGSVEITLNGMINSEFAAATASFSIETFTSGSTYKIDKIASGLTLTNNCNYPCKTCSLSAPSECSSCIQTGVLTKLQGTQCLETCSPGYIEETPGLCISCDTNCEECAGTKTSCTKCV